MRSVKDTALFVASLLTPTLKESKFVETGELTPEEFIAAGDYLVFCFPSWKWNEVTTKYSVKYLPDSKQYLYLKNARCQMRAVSTKKPSVSTVVDGDLSGWDVPDLFQPKTYEEIMDIEEEMMEKEAQDQDQAAISMEDFFETGCSEDLIIDKGFSKNVIMTRTYDLYITYDNYYKVPRLWLMGYRENGDPLTVNETMEDISQDHCNKSVTLMAYPYLNVQIPSIHPCKHAAVMKRMLQMSIEDGKTIKVHQYLTVFLKFIQTVVPTVEYDHSREIDMY